MQQHYWATCGLEVSLDDSSGATRILVDKPYALIGSDPGNCDVVVPSAELARCYVVCWTPDGLRGVSLTYRSSPRQFKVIDGQRGLRFGSQRLRFRPTSTGIAVAAECESELYPAVRWNRGEDRWQHVKLRPGRPLLFGRALPCPLRLDDAAVSAVHGFVYRQGPTLWVVDLASRNGTFVAKRRIDCARVELNSVFHAGTTALHYVAIGETPTATALKQVVSSPTADLLAGQLQASSDEIARLKQRIEELEREVTQAARRSQELDEVAGRLAEERRQFETERGRLVRLVEQSSTTIEDQWSRLAADRSELQQCREQHLAEERTLRLDQQQWQTRLQREMDHLAEREAEVVDLRQQLEATQNQQQQAFQIQQAELAAERQRLDELYRARLAECETADEKLLVRRIRLQRERQKCADELAAREQALRQRELDLERRLCEFQRRHAALAEQRRAAATHRWRISASKQSSVEPAAATPASTHGARESLELANPLLESADFTDILEGALGDDLQIDED